MVTEPLTYLEFLGLQRHASVVITDSGGIQEETTFLGVPCLTMRTTTERPVTVTLGTNELLGQDTEQAEDAARARSSTAARRKASCRRCGTGRRRSASREQILARAP